MNRSPDSDNMPVDALRLSVRAENCLKRGGITTVGQVLDASEEELLSLRNFGRRQYDEVRDRLVELGLMLPYERDDEL